MHEIVPNRLWLGHRGDVRDVRQFLDRGVVAVVDLALNEPVLTLPRDLIYCRLPLVDGAGNDPTTLRLVIETTASLIRAEKATLVLCSVGMSRSLAIAAAAYAQVTQASPNECLRGFGAAMTSHDLSPGLWHEVVAVCHPFGA